MPRRPDLAARQRILAAAAACFQRDGYHGASMDAIAGAAGLRKANLFHYFPGKGALAAAMIAGATEACRAAVRADFADGDPRAGVARAFDRAAAALAAGGCPVGGIAQAAAGCDPAVRAAVAAYFLAWGEELAAALAACRAAGRLPAGLDPGSTASALIALHEGALLQGKAVGHAAPLAPARAVALACLERP